MSQQKIETRDKYELFKAKAEGLGAIVSRASNSADAIEQIAKLIGKQGYKKVVTTELKMVDRSQLTAKLKEVGVAIDSGQPKRSIIEQADVGITEFDTGILDLGTIAQNATDPYVRLMSMLPPCHIALIKTNHFADDFVDALLMLYKNNGNQMPGYVSYVSGPSRTADIERVLTIGVHGPEKLYIIAID